MKSPLINSRIIRGCCLGGAMLLLVAAGFATGAYQKADWRQAALARLMHPPLGLPPLKLSAETPINLDQVSLGAKLFFDRRLSRNGTMSCAMCHVPEQGFTNHELMTPIGVEGRSLRRNAPTLLNVAYLGPLFHDGRERALETQYIQPLTNPNEMAAPSLGHVIALLERLEDYQGLFEKAFAGKGPGADRIGAALALFQRTLLAGNSRFDRYYFAGEDAALSAEEKRGLQLFKGKARCVACHRIGEKSALFTDQQFHDTGYGWRREQQRQYPAETIEVEVAPGVRYPLSRAMIRAVGAPAAADLGRYEVTGDPADLWRFRTPSLRNLTLTAPYMHDGRLSTLEEVVDFYDRGGAAHPGQSPLIKPLGLSEAERRALVAFLKSLTSGDIEILLADLRRARAGR